MCGFEENVQKHDFLAKNGQKWQKLAIFGQNLENENFLQKWCWEAQLCLEINYGSFLTECRKQNFDLDPNFQFLAQNSCQRKFLFWLFWPFLSQKYIACGNITRFFLIRNLVS